MFHASFSGNGKIVKANALATAFSTVPIQWINAQNSITSDDGALTQNGGGWGSSYADASIPSGATCIEFQFQNSGEAMAGFKCGKLVRQ